MNILIISFIILIVILTIFIFVLYTEVYVSSLNSKTNFNNPSQEPVYFGNGNHEITYIVLGDSTGAGQGTSDYNNGIAVKTAQQLALAQKIKMINLSISGAVVSDVLNKQVDKAISYKPDLVLIAVGANDVTHLTSTSSISKDLQSIIDKLIAANSNIKLVLTGVANVSSSPRFYQPLKFIVKQRVLQLNKVFHDKIISNNLTLAPIYEETSPLFDKDKTLFASDKFHPNDRGYIVWADVLNKYLDIALLKQPKHVK